MGTVGAMLFALKPWQCGCECRMQPRRTDEGRVDVCAGLWMQRHSLRWHRSGYGCHAFVSVAWQAVRDEPRPGNDPNAATAAEG